MAWDRDRAIILGRTVMRDSSLLPHLCQLYSQLGRTAAVPLTENVGPDTAIRAESHDDRSREKTINRDEML
jgi:hypothetical protein